MAVQDGEALAFEGVPDINGVVVVSREEETSWQGERERELDRIYVDRYRKGMRHCK